MQSCCFANQAYCFFDVLAAVAVVVAKAPYCVAGRLGRKNKKAQGKESLSLFSSSTARLLFFKLLLFLLKYTAETSAEERIAVRLVHFILIKFTIRRRRRGFPSGPGRAVEIAPSRELKE